MNHVLLLCGYPSLSSLVYSPHTASLSDQPCAEEGKTYCTRGAFVRAVTLGGFCIEDVASKIAAKMWGDYKCDFASNRIV